MSLCVMIDGYGCGEPARSCAHCGLREAQLGLAIEPAGLAAGLETNQLNKLSAIIKNVF